MNTKTNINTSVTAIIIGMLGSLCAGQVRAEAGKKTLDTVLYGSVVVYPPETIGIPGDLSDAITVALVTELESKRIMVHDYRPRFQEMAEAEAADTDQPFKLTTEIKKTIAADLNANNYLDGRLFRLGDEMRFSVSLRKADSTLIVGRTMVLADESDLPIAISRLVESLLTNKSIDETLTLDNATKAETKPKPNRIDLEVNTGLMFGLALGIGDINSHPVIALDSRFELKQVMIQLNLGLGIHGDATYGDAAVAMNYYLMRTSVAPYLGLGGGVFVGNKWAKKGESSAAGSAKFFGGQFFPQVGIEFLRAASIRVHADVRYAVNVSDNRWGHGPAVLVGIAF